MIKLIEIDKVKDKWIKEQMKTLEEESFVILSNFLNNKEKIQKIQRDFSSLFGFKKEIITINAFDNTHFSGYHHIGAMIFSENGELKKNKYRRYNFRNLTSIADDYSMMKEMIYRRLKEIKESDEAIDLLLIDGGRQQMSAVKIAMENLNYYIPFICIKKGDGRRSINDIFIFEDIEIKMNPSSEGLKFLQSLRDEVHRFASTLLRKKHISTIPKE